MTILLSASSIADYIKCPQKVLYRRTKPFPEVKSKEMIIGSIAHLAIEKGWNSKERAYSIVQSGCKQEGLSKADRVNLEFMIDLYFLNFSGLVGADDLIEYNFKIPLYDDVFIVGKMDRVSRGNLLDWKTGRVYYKLGSDPQCIIYNWAFKKQFEKAPSSLCLAFLATGELVPYREDSMCTEELFNSVIPNMIKTIKNSSYYRLGMFNHSCFRCPYKIGCLGKGESEKYELDSGVSPE